MSNLQFNETFYLSTYPDVAAAVSRGQIASGQAHYQSNGRFEGRNPNQFFNTSEYLGRYPDVARSGINPLTHFLSTGAAEGRFANSNEDAAIDLNNNDIADDFNSAAYLTQYTDVAAQVGAGRPFATAYQHFVQFGQFEGRTATLSNGTTITGPFANGGAGAGTPSTGATQVFTDKIDVLTGTNGNDVFVGDANTVSAADSVNGGSGIDTVNLVATNNLPTLSNVERLQFTGSGAQTTDFSAIAGLQELIIKNGVTGNVLTTALNVVTTFDATGTAALAVAAETVATSATATTQIVQLTNGSNIGSLTTNGAAVTNLGIQSNGSAANTIGALAGSSGTTANPNSTLTINGSQKLTITTALDADFTKVDASTSTGGVNLTFLANDVAVTGGSGADRFVFNGNLTTADTAVGGAGIDTIAVAGADYSTVVANGTLAALNTKVTGFEVLEFTGNVATTISGTTFTNTEVTKLLFNTTAADIINSAGSARTYAFGEVNTGAATLNGTAGVTSFNLSLEGIAGNGGDVGALTANFTNNTAAQVGTGTINIASTGVNDAAAPNTTGVITGQSNAGALTSTAVVVTGSHDLTIGGLGTAGSINASTFTGKLIATGSAVQDTITGGTGADTINATAGGDTYTGGAGVDTFVFTNIDQGSRSTLTTISDFTVATDKLNVSAVSVNNGVFNATAVNVTAAPDFTAALNLAAAGDGSANGAVTYFQQGGNTFVVVDNSADATFNIATDAVVRLTGLVTLTATDVVA